MSVIIIIINIIMKIVEKVHDKTLRVENKNTFK